jgi:hypothetical protein
MGYACPVCDDPQQDAEHLANHLAFQALTHGDDHEAWLDEHTPGWAEGGPADLAPRLEGLAEEAEYEVVFEDTTEDSADRERYDPDLQGEMGHGGHGHQHSDDHGHTPPGGDGTDADLDPDAREIVEEAQALTREMLDDERADREE